MEREIILRFRPDKKHATALTYLIGWAFPEEDTQAPFDKVTIYPDHPADPENVEDMTAVYTSSKDPNRQYVIGAIWRGEEYSFHS